MHNCTTLIKISIQKLVKNHLSLKVFFANTGKGGQGLEQSAHGSSGTTVSVTGVSGGHGSVFYSSSKKPLSLQSLEQFIIYLYTMVHLA